MRTVDESSRRTQRGKILELLISARGDWVPLPKITDCAAQYNARIFELRRMGFRITNRTQDVNGVRHSWFRLESGPVQPTAKLVAQSASDEPQPTLFQQADLERTSTRYPS